MANVDQLLFLRQWRRVDLDRIYPPFRSAAWGLIEDLAKQGIYYYATRGFATYPEQQAIYNQGRITPGPIVTKAKPGYSGHCFGINLDFTHDKDSDPRNGLQGDWEVANYHPLADNAPRFGLVSGASFKDWPHIGLPGFVTGDQLAPLRAIFERTQGDDLAKLTAVWSYLDSLPQGKP